MVDQNSAAGARVTAMRSPLGRVRGLGSAKSGASHWWAERLTSVALVPLTIWFVWSVLALAGSGRAAVVVWAGAPLNAVLLLCLVLTTFYHMALGLQVVIEDYIHDERSKLGVLMAMRGGTYLLGLSAVIAVLKLAVHG